MLRIPRTLEEKAELIEKENLETMLGLTAKHLEHPQVSIQVHKDSLFKDVNSFVGPRKKIYLDTNFWVGLRDVDLGRSKNAGFQDSHMLCVENPRLSQEYLIF